MAKTMTAKATTTKKAVSDPRFTSLESPETLRAFVRNLREGIYITNPAGEILDANPAFLEMFGVASLEELAQVRAADLFVDPQLRRLEIEMLRRDGAVREFEFQVRRPDGEVRTLLDTCHRLRDPGSGETVYHGILIDITRRKELERLLHEMSVRDPLTGCYNRRYLAQEQERLNPRQDPWGVIVVDIDNFKEYNDRQGHQAGDEVLVKISRFLMRQVRAEDPVVRFGGDEFVLLLVGEAGLHVEEAARRFHAAIETSAPIPVSFGWAGREDRETLEQTIARADRDLIQVRIEERRRWKTRRRGSAGINQGV